MKKPPRAGWRGRPKKRAAALEPAFFAGDVGGDKILVALRQINDAFDQSDEAARAASHDADDQLDDAFLGVAKIEFMNAQSAQQNAENAGHDFLFRSWRFVAHRFLVSLRLVFTGFFGISQPDYSAGSLKPC